MTCAQIPAPSGYDTGLRLLVHALPIVGRAVFRLLCLATMKIALAVPFFSVPTYHPNCVTPAFLTRVLRSKGILQKGESVVSLRMEPMEMGGIGQVQRVHLTYNGLHSGSSAPASMVAKILGTTVKDAIVGSIVPLSENEHRAYTHKEFTTMVAGLQPDVYHFEMSFFGVGTLLMEDLCGLRHQKSRDGASLEDMKRIVELCAKIHSRTLNQVSVDMVKEFQFHTYFLDHIAGVNCQKALTGPWGECLRAHPRLAETMKLFLDFNNADKLFVKMRGFGFRPADTSVTAKPFSCLIHGDVRLDNCFFDDTAKSVKLVDWQVIMPRTPMLDVGWVLMDCSSETLSMPPMDRLCALDGQPPKEEADACRANVNAVLTAYLSVMSSELSKNPSYRGERPTMAFCQEMLPWVMLSNAFYMMVSVAQIFKEDPKSDASNPVVQTFLAYADRMEWLLRVFVPSINFIQDSD